MKRIIVAAAFALTTVVAFSANAGNILMPAKVVDRDDHSQAYWCQAEDMEHNVCATVQVSDDLQHILIKDVPGMACADNNFGVIGTLTGVGENIRYDGGDCEGGVEARFVRGTQNSQLYVQVYKGKKIFGNYPVH